jgi:hypothetical protein
MLPFSVLFRWNTPRDTGNLAFTEPSLSSRFPICRKVFLAAQSLANMPLAAAFYL